MGFERIIIKWDKEAGISHEDQVPFLIREGVLSKESCVLPSFVTLEFLIIADGEEYRLK